MKKTRMVILGLVAAGTLLTGAVAQSWTQQAVKAYNQENLIRFHIIPNSDAEDDQVLKHRVREAVVEALGPLVSGISDAGEARRVVRDNLELIQRVCETEVAAAGKDYPVRVAYGRWTFPARDYGGLTLAAGDYQAVRVTVGSGTGANWWCVLFPPLCFVNTQVGPDTAEPGGALVTVNSPGADRLEIRLRFAEVWQRSAELATQFAGLLTNRDREKES